MNAIEFQKANERYIEIINFALTGLLRESNSVYPRLAEAMGYSLLSGGKRIRPCITLAVCEMLNGNMEKALPLACGIELIHTYSLIHDDLPCMDDDAMRRGKPSNHVVFGEAMAVLAGDGLLTFAFEQMLKKGLAFNDPYYYMAISRIAELAGASGMVSGQAADILTNPDSVSELDTLLYIHRHKTADMLTAAVVSGAYSAHASDDIINSLQSYASYIGLLFQITDDMLDNVGESSVNNDGSRLTYVSLLGIDGARKAANLAAADARKTIAMLPNSHYLEHTIDSILMRSC